MALPLPPFPAFLVDLARRMTLPWRDWLTQLVAAVDGQASRVEVLETRLTGAGAVTLETVEVDLGARRRRAGALELELAAVVDGPVVVVQGGGPRPADGQASQILALAEPRGGRRVRVHWLAVGDPARGRLVLHVLRGVSDHAA